MIIIFITIPQSNSFRRLFGHSFIHSFIFSSGYGTIGKKSGGGGGGGGGMGNMMDEMQKTLARRRAKVNVYDYFVLSVLK